MRKSTFVGFEPSNTTAVPDILFDELLSELSGAELKVLLYIIRRTIGFKKSTDAISFTQFEDGIKTHEGKVLDKGCGLNRETISNALKSLEARHCIKSEKRSGTVTFYSICFKGDTVNEDTDQQTSRKNQLDQSKKPTSQLVGKSVTTSRKNSISLVGKSDPQLDSNTNSQYTNIQKEREATSPEEIHSFTPSELCLLQWIEEKHINIAKSEATVKTQLEKLAPVAKTKAELQSLIETAQQVYPNINDLSLGNLVNKRVLNAHALQSRKSVDNTPEITPQEDTASDITQTVLWTRSPSIEVCDNPLTYIHLFEEMLVTEARHYYDYDNGTYGYLMPEEEKAIRAHLAQEPIAMEG
jgi:DNA-binding transcriptional regulator YhcF (GntR family)